MESRFFGDEKLKILVVDDESAIRDTLRMILEFEGVEVLEAEDGYKALEIVKRKDVDVIILDIKMPGMDGIECLSKLREIGNDAPVVMISGHATVNSAIESIKLGAFDFIEKPLQKERILVSIKNAYEKLTLQRKSLYSSFDKDILVGKSKQICNLRKIIEQVSPTPVTVLILGESGTGKELVAREIHRGSKRANAPFIHVNCAAIPDELIEAELFGFERGSFTGAIKSHRGKFAQANKGTIFLDEVGDMSPKTQAKVLRVLQEGEIEPVGGSKTLKVDVRVVAATNKDLEEEIAKGNFREDLYYRLNVFPIVTPPLREHKEDIPLLVDYFVKKFVYRGYRYKEFTTGALEALAEYNWPGNVRELKNFVERLLILVSKPKVEADDVRKFLVGGSKGFLEKSILEVKTLREFKEVTEKMFILYKLERNNWNITKTAREIDTPRSNLYKKIEQYNLKRGLS